MELQPQEEKDPQIESISDVPPWGTYRKDWIKSPLNQVDDKAQEEKTEETIEEKMVNISKRIWKLSNLVIWNNKHEQSILQNLRAELERYIYEYDCNYEPDETVRAICGNMLSLLNELEDKNTITGVFDNKEDLIKHLDSLSKKKETQPNSSETPNSSIPDWTPTPWEMIEVSNDGEKWYKRKYTGMWQLEQYACEWDFTTWIYARPAPEELKPLPKYKANRIAPDGRHKLAHPNRNEVQLELLTTTVNLLIDKLNNK